MAWECLITPLMKIWGGSRHLQPAPPDVQPIGGEPRKLVSTDKLVTEPGYHKPSPLVWLIGCANEAKVVLEGVETMALVDTGSKVSTLTEGFCSKFQLKILSLGVCIFRGQGVLQYFIIPGLPWYIKDVLFLVIDHLVMTMTMEELQQAWNT